MELESRYFLQNLNLQNKPMECDFQPQFIKIRQDFFE
jgi:hypothetical protein